VFPEEYVARTVIPHETTSRQLPVEWAESARLPAPLFVPTPGFPEVGAGRAPGRSSNADWNPQGHQGLVTMRLSRSLALRVQRVQRAQQERQKQRLVPVRGPRFRRPTSRSPAMAGNRGIETGSRNAYRVLSINLESSDSRRIRPTTAAGRVATLANVSHRSEAGSIGSGENQHLRRLSGRHEQSTRSGKDCGFPDWLRLLKLPGQLAELQWVYDIRHIVPRHYAFEDELRVPHDVTMSLI